MELQRWDAEHNRIVAELCDEHRHGLLMFDYCEVGVGSMRHAAGGCRVAFDDLKASGILKGCKKQLVMVWEFFVH